MIGKTGNWYKGNLHMHTTRSDGRLSPEKAAEIYRAAGYDFIALTDHWVQSETSAKDGLLFLSGCELDTGDMLEHPLYHIIGIGMESRLGLERSIERPVQELIDAVRGAGGLAILAHPYWSVNVPEECMKLRGLSGAEIYNTISGMPYNGRADSSTYFDIWASQGCFLHCMAADDSHYYAGEETRSFLMVNAPDLSSGSILKSLREGAFYASQGPRFGSVVLDGSTLEVECPGAESILFYSNTVWCEDRVFTGGVDGAKYRIKPTDRYVRIELIDRGGRHAWSNVIPL